MIWYDEVFQSWFDDNDETFEQRIKTSPDAALEEFETQEDFWKYFKNAKN